MSKLDDKRAARGCLFFIGIGCLAVGIGMVWGQEYGWIFAGATFLGIIAVSK